MATDFKIEIPIKVKTGSKKQDEDIGKKIAEQIKQSLQTIGVGEGTSKSVGKFGGKKAVGILGAILATIDAIFIFIKPIFSLLRVVLILLFIPLVPIMKVALSALKAFAEGAKDAPQIGLTGEPVLDVPISIANIALRVGAAIGEFLVWLGRGAFELGERIGHWLFDTVMVPIADSITDVILSTAGIISSSLTFLASIPLMVWNTILKPAWEFFIGIGERIWTNILEPAWSWFKDIGSRIWNILVGGFMNAKNLLVDGFKLIINGIIDLVNRIPGINVTKLAEGGIVTKPTFAMIGEAGPEAVIPLNKGGLGNTINITINKPTVRNDADLKTMANEVGRILQRQMPGRISSG